MSKLNKRKSDGYVDRRHDRGMMNFDSMVNSAFDDDFFRDPFENFSGFGGFGGFGGMERHMLGGGHSSLMNDFGLGSGNMMMRFNSSGGGNQGTVFSSSYVSTTTMDKNGRPVKKEFSSQGIDQYNKDGTKISEKQQSYKDYDKGIKKASQQRLLNDVGQKIVKTRDYKNNHESEDHYYHNLQESKIYFLIF